MSRICLAMVLLIVDSAASDISDTHLLSASRSAQYPCRAMAARVTDRVTQCIVVI